MVRFGFEWLCGFVVRMWMLGIGVKGRFIGFWMGVRI